MKKNHKILILITFVLFGMIAGCKKWTDQEKYKRPNWLPGKLYTTVAAQENLSMFTECLKLAGLDAILDVSGSWTVFAPTDEAMKQYLAENHFASITDIPIDKLVRITEFHIIQNPWTLDQLKSLGAYGWRTGNDNKKNSYAYKRQTMLKNPVEKYWIKRAGDKDMIVMDSTTADGYKRVYVQSRKYVPIFYDEYLNINGFTSEDYRFYFNRDYEQGNVYYAGAKIIKPDIAAENGFVHIIDKVVDPMLNGKELLEKEMSGQSYKLFLQLVNWYYPSFDANITATFNQQSVRLGGYVDTLWDLTYRSPVFDLQGELINNINSTLVDQNGMYIPTDDAFGKFIDNILTVKSGFPHWPDYKSLPLDIVDIIVSAAL